MGRKSALPPFDRVLARLAAQQYGVVSHEQLLALGLGAHGITERLGTGRLHRVHRGVYSVGHPVLRREAVWLAAVLACGAGAVLSHRDAAALWELRPDDSAAVDVTVPSQNGRRRRRGLEVHRSARLSSAEITVRHGIPVTTVARTLLDLADVLPRQALKRALDQAEYRRLFDLTALRAVVDANPGRRGALVLRLAQAPPELTRSPLEERFLALVERYGLPRPRVAVDLDGYVADFLWPAEKLIVETDGLRAHGTRAGMEGDRRRDRRLLVAGYRTVRLTPTALASEGASIAAELRAILGQPDTSSARRPARRRRASSKSATRARTSSARDR